MGTNPNCLKVGRINVVTIACVLWSGLMIHAGARAAEPLLKPMPARHDIASLDDPTVVRSRCVLVDFDLLASRDAKRQASLEFNLFDDAKFVGLVENINTRPPDGYELRGHLAGQTHGTFILVVNRDVMLANLRDTDGGSYQVRYLGDGVHVAREIDESRFPPCRAEHEHPALWQPQALGAAPVEDYCDDGSEIDVLVVYTPIARDAVGGTTAMEALIELSVAESNIAYANSQINPRLSLVYMGETDYSESAGFSDHLHRLQSQTDGYMDEVHELRDRYRADLVALLVDDQDVCGIAYVIQELSLDFAAFGFSVISHSCAAGNLTFAHELGHNQGCAHDHDNASVQGLYEYSYGYQDPDQLFRTVMAYSCPDGCPRVSHFSNPDVTYDGLPTGNPLTDPEPTHNALTINESALTIANFRHADCNCNGIPDEEDIASGFSEDCNANGFPDECEPECNGNGIPDDCDIAQGTSEDCTGNGVPDECEADCNKNGIADTCDIAFGPSTDENDNAVPDDCEPPIVFVDANATGLSNGASWPDAFNDLLSALAAADFENSLVQEIWVAAGTYKPAGPGGNRTLTFKMANGVDLYGGFAGYETEREQRDPAANLTILSGDLNGDDSGIGSNCCYDHTEPGCDDAACEDLVCAEDSRCCTIPWARGCNELALSLCGDLCTRSDNSFNVLKCRDIDATTIIDGFTIMGGNAPPGTTLWGGGMRNSDSSPTVRNCTFIANYAYAGGAVMNAYDSAPTFVDCTFTGNAASSGGAISNNFNSNPTLINCAFFDNWAFIGGAINNGTVDGTRALLINCVLSGNRARDGGAIFNWYGGDSRLINCTLSANWASETGGGIYNRDIGTSRLTNCILWGNSDASGTGLSAQINGGFQMIDHSCIQGLSIGSGATGNINMNPRFVDVDGADNIVGTPDDDLRLMADSPCIDAGDSAAVVHDLDHPDSDGDTTEPTPLDLAGLPRLVDDLTTPDTGSGDPPIVDMGPYEEHDCNDNGIGDLLDIQNETSSDCDQNDIPDECDVECNGNHLPDSCDIAEGTSEDCTGNGVPDECEPDCNYNGIADLCEIADSLAVDCNHNDVPDPCDLASGYSHDDNGDRIPDDCEPLPGVLFVNATARGQNTGLTWPDAFSNLQEALTQAAASGGLITQIWVAAGIYHPEPDNPDTPNNASFELINGVALYGGFSARERHLPERNVAIHETILSGDIADDDALQRFDDNIRPVIDSPYDTDATAVLDGFTITAGRGGNGPGMFNTGASPTVRNCTFTNNHGYSGGAVFFSDDSHATFINCLFTHNTASYAGGAMSCMDSTPTLINCAFYENAAGRGGAIEYEKPSMPSLINCIFSGNYGAFYGGAIRNVLGAAPHFINCTLAGNYAGLIGGGVYVDEESAVTLTNSIVWDNLDSDGYLESSQITGGLAIINHSCIEGWTGALGGTGNSGSDPRFVDSDRMGNVFGSLDRDFRLTLDSPYIDAGDNTAVLVDRADLDGDGDTTEPIPFDLDFRARFVDVPDVGDTGIGTAPIVDLGAYETGDDCNANGIDDISDVLAGTSVDCNTNNMPDECEADCNGNLVADECDITAGTSEDCNVNGVPDECDIATSSSDDCNGNGVPDECEPDSDGDGVLDECEQCANDGNKLEPGICGCGLPDIDTDNDTVLDCNDVCPGFDDLTDDDQDGIANGCDKCEGFDDSLDLDGDTAPDACDSCEGFDDLLDADGDGVPNGCDLCEGFDDSADCNANGTSDGCDIRSGGSMDVDGNLIPDECEVPVVGGRGCRYLAVTAQPPESRFEVALHVSSPDYPCLGKYMDNEGRLQDYRTLKTPDQWGLQLVGGREIVPSTIYHVQAESPTGIEVGEAATATTGRWGDTVGTFIDGSWTPPDGGVDFDDISGTVDAFRQLPDAPAFEWCNVAPDIPDAVIDFQDIGSVVDAFRGLLYPFTGPDPCP